MAHPLHKAKPPGAGRFDDMGRVLSLGVDPGLSEDELTALNEIYCEERALAKLDFKLFPVQAHAILSIFENDGGFMPIGVGWGKTLICLKTAADFWFEKGIKRPAIFVPPQVAGQLTKRDLPWLRQRIKMHGVPVISLYRKGEKARKHIAEMQKEGIYIIPYSALSNKDAVYLLDTLQPDMLILDEAHKVKRPNAARTRRLRNYIHKNKPKVVALSGTITNRSLLDYHHTITACLGDIAPVPLTQTRTLDWANVVDATARPDPVDCEILDPLLQWAKENFPDETFEGDRRAYRTAYKLRLRSAPGIVASGDEDIGTSLYFVNHEVESKSERLKKLVKQVDEEWLTPSGDEIDYAIHKAAWLRQLSSGFYYEHYWPEDIDDLILDRSQDYLAAKNEYNRQMRTWLKTRARDNLDTPMLVAAEMSRTGASVVGPELYEAWCDMHDLDFDGRVDRNKRMVKVCGAKVSFAQRWAKQQKNGIIWVYHKDLGAWLHDEIQDSVYCPAGRAGDDRIYDTQGRVVIASYPAHGTGKNLQFHENQLFFQFPREAHIMEQLLGRLHRNGQKADEIICHNMLSTEFDHLSFAAMLNDSLYIHQTGSRQKAIIAGYSPRPKIFPPEVLIERGFHDIKTLSPEDRKLYVELFSDTNET